MNVHSGDTWGSPPGTDEPELWLRDTFPKDGSSYDEHKVVFIGS